MSKRGRIITVIISLFFFFVSYGIVALSANVGEAYSIPRIALAVVPMSVLLLIAAYIGAEDD